jgi:hypothetical protein
VGCRPALLVDLGFVGNLRGDAWAKSIATAAAKAGLKPSYTKRDRPVNVKGVGKGAQQCKCDRTLPIALRKAAGDSVTLGSSITPMNSGSEFLSLLGLSSLRKNRGICGPGDYELQKAFPPGSDSFQLELAPSGHLVFPCCELDGEKAVTSDDFTLSLVTRSQPVSSRKMVPPLAPQYSPMLRTSMELVPPPGIDSA